MIETSLYDPIVYSKTLRLVRNYVLRNSGIYADVEDIMQEGLLVFFRNLKNPEFNLTTTHPEFYIYSVCQKLWLKELERRRKSKTYNSTGELMNITEDPNEDYQLRKENLLKIIQKSMKLLSPKCQQVFKYREEGLSCDQIADKMNFSGRGIAKDKIFRCKKRLIQLIQKDEEYLDLIEEECQLIKRNY